MLERVRDRENSCCFKVMIPRSRRAQTLTLSVRSNYCSISLSLSLVLSLDPICTFSQRLYCFSLFLYSICATLLGLLAISCIIYVWGKTGLATLTHTHSLTPRQTHSCVPRPLLSHRLLCRIMRTSLPVLLLLYFASSIRVFLLLSLCVCVCVCLAHFQTFCFLIKFYVAATAALASQTYLHCQRQWASGAGGVEIPVAAAAA